MAVGRQKPFANARLHQIRGAPETIAQRGPTTVESDRHDFERMTYYLRVRPDTDVP